MRNRLATPSSSDPRLMIMSGRVNREMSQHKSIKGGTMKTVVRHTFSIITLLLISCWVICQPSFATITVGVSGHAHSTDNTPATATVTLNTTGVQGIIVGTTTYYHCYDKMSDSNGNIWVILSREDLSSGVVNTLWQAMPPSVGGGISVGTGHTFTPTVDMSQCTDGGLTFSTIFVQTWTTTSTAHGPGVDQTSQAHVGAVASITTGSVTPHVNNEIVFSLLGINSNGTVSSIGIDSGFTVVGTENQTSNSLGGALAYKIQTTAATVQPQWSWTDSSPGTAQAVNATIQDVLPLCSGGSHSFSAPDFDDIDTCMLYVADAGTDTITVANGSYHVYVQHFYTKAVRIVANGYSLASPGTSSSTVTIYDDRCSGYCADNDGTFLFTESPNGKTYFEGFTFSDGTSFHAGGSGVFHLNHHTANPDDGKPIIVQGLTYNATNTTGDRVIFHVNTNKGLVTYSTFNGTPAMHSSSCTTADLEVIEQKMGSPGDPAWETPPTWGNLDTTGEKNFYFENNTVNSINIIYDGDDYARGVFRFNIFTNATVGSHGDDTSGTGVRHYEAYFNKFIYDSSTPAGCTPGLTFNVPDGFINSRGAVSHVFNNRIDQPLSGGNPGDTIELLEEPIILDRGDWGCWGVGGSPNASLHRPSPRQIGWGYSTGSYTISHAFNQGSGIMMYQDLKMDQEPDWFFGNYGSSISNTPSISSGGNWGSMALFQCDVDYGAMAAHDAATDYIKADEEYYADTYPTAFNGTTGVGANNNSGTNSSSNNPRSSRPSTCTTGVLYWSTDQGSWNTSGSGGEGVLDRCTSTNTWTNDYYHPYTFPHPATDVMTGPQLVFTTQPVNVHAGHTMTTFVVKATTDGSTVDTSFNGTVTIAHAFSCGATAGGTLTPTASSGVATFNAVTETGASSGTCSFTATATSYSSVTSNAFWVGPNQIAFTAQPNATYASGATVSVSNAVQFGDGTTDTADADSNTITIGSCASSISGGSTTQNASSGTLSWSINVSGSGTACRFTTTDASAGLAVTSNSFNVTGPTVSSGGIRRLGRIR